MYLIITVMYVKKITSFCQVLKKMHAKENWFFSASRCVLQTVIVNKLADWWAAAVVGCWRPIYDASISIWRRSVVLKLLHGNAPWRQRCSPHPRCSPIASDKRWVTPPPLNHPASKAPFTPRTGAHAVWRARDALFHPGYGPRSLHWLYFVDFL